MRWRQQYDRTPIRPKPVSQHPYIKYLFTDGSCPRQGGTGGWAVVAVFSDNEMTSVGGRLEQTTSNRAELFAALQACEVARLARAEYGQKSVITVYSDSQYVVRGLNGWVKGWIRNHWRTAAGTPVVNQDLWEALHQMNDSSLRWCWVKGHNGNPGNEQADLVAGQYARGELTN